eukprot:CAMPEP_0115665942 /NCGR_PEP_ID=MMETSP0272-20121206/49149_1 /TAXON_ID=71861 /ORGANISM="Scrippsiella trochoidea, Strain CCMP3099" /LENGTH=85 /DNA_ID=CAMNT_0003104403 /DNA_START=232 /DNA_END=489 /DNA_ORIENTATION=-
MLLPLVALALGAPAPLAAFPRESPLDALTAAAAALAPLDFVPVALAVLRLAPTWPLSARGRLSLSLLAALASACSCFNAASEKLL